jgi:FG-GAP repeat
VPAVAPGQRCADRRWGAVSLLLLDPTANGSTGAAHVVFGQAPAQWGCTGSPCAITLSALNGTNGVIIHGVTSGDQLGYTGAAADMNGDGIKDIVVCAPHASNHGSDSGSCYVIYGHKGAWAATVDLTTLN